MLHHTDEAGRDVWWMPIGVVQIRDIGQRLAQPSGDTPVWQPMCEILFDSGRTLTVTSYAWQVREGVEQALALVRT